jgi:hypothetical protein
MPLGRKQCPCCPKTQTTREILRHVNQQHAGIVLTKDQLEQLEAYQCSKCRKALSRSFKGAHKCIAPGESVAGSKKSSNVQGVSVTAVARSPRASRCPTQRQQQQQEAERGRHSRSVKEAEAVRNQLHCRRAREANRVRDESCSHGSGSNCDHEQEAVRRLLESPARIEQRDGSENGNSMLWDVVQEAHASGHLVPTQRFNL